MLDKIEIYPYQRINENPNPKKNSLRKRMPKPKLKFLIPSRQKVGQFLYFLLTRDNFVLGLVGLLLARAFLLGELAPFVFAYLAGFGYQKKHRSIMLTISTALGMFTVLNGFALWQNIAALIVLALAVNSIKLPPKYYSWALPFLSAAVLFLTKSSILLWQGINFYGEMIITFEAVLTGILGFVFILCNNVWEKKKALVDFNFEEICALAILSTALLLGLNNIYIAGFSVSSILCRFCILSAAYLWGSGGGTMMGVMAGIIPSIASSVFAQTLGMYAISGLLAGLFRIFGRASTIIGFLLGMMALSFFTAQSELTHINIGENLISSVMFFLLINYFKENLPFENLGPITRPEIVSPIVEKDIKEYAQNRIHHLAQVFDELSASFYPEEKHDTDYQPGGGYLNYLYDTVASQVCRQCSGYNYCWNRDCCNTCQELLDLFTLAENKETLLYEDCPPALKKKCINTRDLINKINHLFDSLRLHEYWKDKLDTSQQILAHQLRGVGQVVKNLAEKISFNNNIDYKLREDLIRQAKRLGLEIQEISPIRRGENQMSIKVLAPQCKSDRKCEKDFLAAFSSCAGINLEIASKNCHNTDPGYCEFTLCPAFNYIVTSGAAQAARESICGDSYAINNSKDGKAIAILSDGMGVGEKAYQESHIAVKLIESLLNSGFDKEVAIQTINSVLLLRSNIECFATLDMVMIDLYSGEADFIKTAAAPSFIKRGQQVEVLRSSSLPMGILQDMDVFSKKISLFPDDIIVMVSDGVLEIFRHKFSEAWFQKLLSGIIETDCQRLADYIISQALSISDGHPQDDMTVICLRIARR